MSKTVFREPERIHSFNTTYDIPVWLWLVLPLAIALAPYFANDLDRALFKDIFIGELGLIENFTALFLLIFLTYCVRIFFYSAIGSMKPYRLWFFILFLGGFYFLGEEISWGQHYFGWMTPEAWQMYNNQQEMNLHNLDDIPIGFGVTLDVSFLFNSLPRLLLTLMAVIGGLLLPIILMLKPLFRNGSLMLLTPSLICLPTAALAILSTSLYKAFALFSPQLANYFMIEHVGKTNSELKECLLALFLMIYAMSVLRRLVAQYGVEQVNLSAITKPILWFRRVIPISRV